MIDIDPKWLRDQYEVNLRTAGDIAKELGCGNATVCRRLRQYGIGPRPKHLASRLAKTGYHYDDAEGARLYQAGLSTTDVARRLNASKKTVLASLERQGIPRRSKSEATLLRRDTGQRKYPKVSEMRGLTGACAFCGVADRLEIHHIDGVCSNNAPANLVHLCWEHHVMVEFFIGRALVGIRTRERESFVSLRS